MRCFSQAEAAWIRVNERRGGAPSQGKSHTQCAQRRHLGFGNRAIARCMIALFMTTEEYLMKVVTALMFSLSLKATRQFAFRPVL